MTELSTEEQLKNCTREYKKLLTMLHDKYPDAWNYYTARLVPPETQEIKNNPIETKQFMKDKYPDLDDFDNLQFVRTCAEDGVRKYKVKVKKVVDDMAYPSNCASFNTKEERQAFHEGFYLSLKKLKNMLDLK